MQVVRQVVVIDAADLEAESTFWATLLDGRVFRDERWHTVIDSDGQWRIGVQLNLDHTPPVWPAGVPTQQVHMDLHVADPRPAHERAMAAGARLLSTVTDMNSAQGHHVYADPAGHPFCIGWGHPTQTELAKFIATGAQ